MKKLPKIYQNTIDKEIKNNESFYYGKQNSFRKDSNNMIFTTKKEIEKAIDEILKAPTYSFNIETIIHTKEKIYDTSLIAKVNGVVITFDNDKIPITEITKLEKKS